MQAVGLGNGFVCRIPFSSTPPQECKHSGKSQHGNIRAMTNRNVGSCEESSRLSGLRFSAEAACCEKVTAYHLVDQKEKSIPDTPNM